MSFWKHIFIFPVGVVLYNFDENESREREITRGENENVNDRGLLLLC